MASDGDGGASTTAAELPVLVTGEVAERFDKSSGVLGMLQRTGEEAT
jgi:hypothetical protein